MTIRVVRARLRRGLNFLVEKERSQVSKKIVQNFFVLTKTAR